MLGRNGLADNRQGARDEAVRLADLGGHQLFPPAARLELGVAEQLAPGQHGPRRHAPLLEPVHQLEVAGAARPHCQRAVDLVVPGAAAFRRLEARVLRPGRVTHRLPERPPLRVALDGDRDPLVAARARVDALGGGARAAIAGGLLHASVEGVVHHRLAEQADGHLPLRAVDQAADPTTPRLSQPGDQGADGQQAGDGVGVDAARGQRHAVEVPGDRRQASGLLERRPERAVVPLRAAVALAAQLDVDQVLD